VDWERGTWVPVDQPRPFDPIAGFEPGSWTVGEDDYRPGEVSAANRELIDDDDSQERWRPVGEIPYIGWTSLLVDADDLVFDSGYHIKIEYVRNSDVPDCEENSALDIPMGGLRPGVIQTVSTHPFSSAWPHR
jgi:hypothetical protein